MDANEIARLASAESTIPDGMSLIDEWLYYNLRDMYRSYRAGNIDSTTGTELKNAAVKRYTEECARLRMQNEMISQQAYLWQNIETAGSAYAMAETHTPEADRLYGAVYRCKVRREET